MATVGTLVSASISKNVHCILVYICTNFGAFIKKVQNMPDIFDCSCRENACFITDGTAECVLLQSGKFFDRYLRYLYVLLYMYNVDSCQVLNFILLSFSIHYGSLPKPLFSEIE